MKTRAPTVWDISITGVISYLLSLLFVLKVMRSVNKAEESEKKN
jgi:hypothetical protein